jgi:hypothetical protein
MPLALFVAPLAAAAQSCSGGGGPTLVTVTLDGTLSDWDNVLANAMQLSTDGAWTSFCNASTDRDCRGNGNLTGRDLYQFAWTYDANNIYLYTTRFGSTSNSQIFYYYMDLGNNARMNSGDKVLEVSYQGSTRATSAILYNYIPADAINGDAMVAPSGPSAGYADGYTLPGLLPLTGTTIYTGQITGFADGSGFETRVPFTALGVPSGTALYFHVSSSNTSIAGAASSSQIDDNLAGTDGKIGAFSFFASRLSPDRTSTVPAGSPATATYLHTMANTGTLDDRYNLFATSSEGYRLDLYDDSANILMATDFTGDGTWDFVSPSYNADANGRPDVTIPAGGSIMLRLLITATAGANNVTDFTTLQAISSGNASCAPAAATDTTNIQTLPPGLMRNATLTTLTPSAAQMAAIFPRAPGDPSMSAADTVVPSYNSGASFPTETSDFTDTTISIIFYQVENSNPNLRVMKDVGNGKIVITH